MEDDKIIISEKAKKLLNTPLPEPPRCNCCSDECLANYRKELIEYYSIKNKYRINDVLDYAIKLRTIRIYNSHIDELLSKVRELISQLPKEVTEVLDDDIYGWPKNVFGEDINYV